LQRQPQKLRDELARLPEDQRNEKIAEQRKEERLRIAAWMRALRVRSEAHPDKPVRASDFGAEGERYVNEVLRPQLTAEEAGQLKMADGKWPYYTRTVLDLADKHPVKLPGPAKGIARHYDLPDDYRTALTPAVKNLPKSQQRPLEEAGGKWPDYAIEVTKLVRPGNPQLKPLGPSRAADFAAPVKEFIETKLLPKLSPQEKADLAKEEGKWPEYPTKVLALAGLHTLEVPLMRLPGADQWREKVGDALPEVPDRTLRDFALNDLTSEERTKLGLSVNDPASRDRLVQEYFRKNPHERKRLERLDGQTFNGGRWPPAKSKPGL
jgi:hypothetical protein